MAIITEERALIFINSRVTRTFQSISMSSSSAEETVSSSEPSSLSLEHGDYLQFLHITGKVQSRSTDETDRLNTLKTLQIAYNRLESDYLKSVNNLEYQFHEQCSHLFERRAAIINGTYEPSDDECRLKTDFIDTSEQTIVGNDDEAGIPSFWLQTLQQVRSKGRLWKTGTREVLRIGTADC